MDASEAISYLDPSFLTKVLSAAFVGSSSEIHHVVTQLRREVFFQASSALAEARRDLKHLLHWLS